MFSSNSSTVSGDANYIEDVFSTYLYTGNGGAQTITNGIDLAGKGGLVWVKSRSDSTNHKLLDSAIAYSSTFWDQSLTSNSTAAAAYYAGTGAITAQATGFRINSGDNAFISESGYTYASWTFRKQPKFFDVQTYTGAGSVDYAHSLGSVPGFALYKATNGTSNWNCVCRKSDGTYELLQLNTTASTFTTYANAAAAGLTSTTFNPSATGSATPGTQFIAYLFAHNAGGFGLTGTDNVISCGSFTTDGAGAATVDLGYEPQWMLVKRNVSGGNWYLLDTMRGWVVDPTGGAGDRDLYANLSNAEAADNLGNPTATGFYFKEYTNAPYIYIAIRRGPMKVPTLGTTVFKPVIGNNSGPPGFVSGFPVDAVFLRQYRTSSEGPTSLFSRLTGGKLLTYTTAVEATGYSYEMAFSNGFLANTADSENVAEMFRRAPGFFDVVCYTGTGVARTVAHNLAAAPEMMIVKNRSNVEVWAVYNAAMGNQGLLMLNSNDASQTTSSVWNSTTPTSTVFYTNADTAVNGSGDKYVAYLFATCPGVSKVGGYIGAGLGTSQIINCGFTAGARFILIKRADGGINRAPGNWYVWDSARGIVASSDPYLLLNSTAYEYPIADFIDPSPTGFEISTTAPAQLNNLGESYIFLAIS